MDQSDRERHFLPALGAACLLAAILAALAGFLETLLAPSHGKPSLIDLLYGVNIHLLLALGIALGTRLLFWRSPDLRFPWTAAGCLLIAELGIVVPIWLSVDPVLGMPPFRSLTGKLLVLAAFLAGGTIAVLLTLGLRRALPDLGRAWSRGTPGRLGLVLAVLLLIVNGLLLSRAAPRSVARFDGAPDAALERPDVFVILVDTLRRDHLSFFDYGRPTTPEIDQFYQSCYVFSSAYTPSNWTVPSVASLFTGLYPTSHGVYGHYLAVPEQALTMAEAFQAHGYQTAAFIDNPAISAANQFDQGFDFFFPSWRPWWSQSGRTFLERWARNRSGIRTQASWTRSFGPGVNWQFFHWLDARLAEARAAEGDATEGGSARQPLFIYVHYMEPHHPYRPPPQHREIVAPGAPWGPDQTPHLLTYLDDEECRDWECLQDPPEFEPADLEGMVANYDGEIRHVDLLVGQLVEGLRERGLLEDGHLLMFSDHGEEFFDHRGWRHTYSIYEEVTGCVMAYHPPGGLPGGELIERPVGMLDLARSIFDRLGFEAPPQHQGRVIPEVLDAARVRGEAGDAPAPGSSARFGPGGDEPVLSELPPHLYSLRLRNWKLLRRGPLSDPEWRLFDLVQDPDERTNLAAAFPDTLASLRGYLDGILAQLARTSFGEREPITDPETLARLKALGYLQ